MIFCYALSDVFIRWLYERHIKPFVLRRWLHHVLFVHGKSCIQHSVLIVLLLYIHRLSMDSDGIVDYREGLRFFGFCCYVLVLRWNISYNNPELCFRYSSSLCSRWRNGSPLYNWYCKFIFKIICVFGKTERRLSISRKQSPKIIIFSFSLMNESSQANYIKHAIIMQK